MKCRKCVCGQVFTPRGSNHLRYGSITERTGCSWENHRKKQAIYGAKYRQAKRIGHWPDGKIVPTTRKCLDCKESFVLTVKGYRKVRCSVCGFKRKRHQMSDNYFAEKSRKCTPRPTAYNYQPKPCCYCQKEFRPTNAKVKYCTDECAYNQQKIQIGEAAARRRLWNRQSQRRLTEYEKRTNRQKISAIAPPITLQKIPVGEKFEQIIKGMLGA